jgi:hypothetical protein
MPENVRYEDGKKFMWDGKEYATEDEAKGVADGYAGDGFDIFNLSEEGKFFVYTRRVVKEVVVEGGA